MPSVIDQAQRLREMVELMSQAPPPVSLRVDTRPVRTLAVTSGKGGVGKSNIVANLAIALARRGRKILVIDADLSLANIHLLMGLQPRFNLSHVISGEKRLGEIVVQDPHGVKVIPASNGVAELAMLRGKDLEGLMDQFADFIPEMDLVLIDTAAGLSDSVLSFVHAAGEALIVTTPEPTAYLDAYHMLKNIHVHDPIKPVHLVVNMAASEREARKTSAFMVEMAGKFLGHPLSPLGEVLRDPDVPNAIRNQRAFIEDIPHGIATRGIQSIATKLLNASVRADGASGDGSSLWRRVVSYLKKGAA